MAELTETREIVRERYAAAAARPTAVGCAAGRMRTESTESSAAGSTTSETAAEAPAAAVESLARAAACPPPWPTCTTARRCSTSGRAPAPTCSISARRVGPTGRAIGLDMTDEMLELARANAREAGVDNVGVRQGLHRGACRFPTASVDVVISNCVINLSADKPRVLREAARVLRSGGRFAVSDVIADEDMDEATRADMAAWTGCVAGALTRAEYERALRDAGFVDVEVRETHRVHEHAASAIIRARKP